MQFSLDKSLEILERTPNVLQTMLEGLSDEWTVQNEGPETWSPYDIVGHLIYGEKTDWMPRAEIILSAKADKSFTPFDRFAQFRESKGAKLKDLLREFGQLREKNMERLRAMRITEKDLEKTGIHPAFGAVTLSQLLAAWVVHDLNHIYQISRVMAKEYQSAVGPWTAYLKILQY